MGFSIFSFLEAEGSPFTLRLIDVKWLSLLDWIIMNNYDQGSTKREPEEATPWSQMVSQIRNTRCLILSIYISLLYLPSHGLIVGVLKVQLEQERDGAFCTWAVRGVHIGATCRFHFLMNPYDIICGGYSGIHKTEEKEDNWQT